MERRTFVKGAFGLIVVAAGSGLGFLGGCGGAASSSAGNAQTAKNLQGAYFTTPICESPETAPGPAMEAGICLARNADGKGVSGYFEETHLFNVDETGAALIELADGNLTLEGIASAAGASLGSQVNPADVAAFFVSLGQAGFLKNTVLVNLVEIPA